MKLITNIFLLFLLISCSSEQFTFEQYENYPVKVARKTVTYPNNTFEFLLPIKWEWKVENYDEVDEISIGIDAFSKPNEKNFIDAISIQKGKGFSNSKTLETEYKIILEKLRQNSGYKLIESGKTLFNENDSYFVHYRSNSGNSGEIEIISLITKSKNDNSFYYLNASASRTNDLKKNMSIMVQCLKTFKEK
ncbi:hypothetical protein FIA58_011380 [Flavobacterium jejuense]|uniref:PsbP C-terminal domain-containing protein n=1 Tax=Flavobacterium jejuense TaxID=1544455 RepID=A0ABX0IWX4_9FLAO|nr:hypothetical protein [Flavobacterium jejuense]NHN26280.1 hypothetical protein [Flavobacterium jejuense]